MVSNQLSNSRSVRTVSYEAKKRLNEKLDNCVTLAEVFELVKGSVKRRVHYHLMAM